MTKTPPQWQKHHHTTTKTQPHHTNTTTKTPPNHHKNTTTETPPQKHHHKEHHKNTTTPPQKRHHKNTTTRTPPPKHHHKNTKTPPHHHKKHHHKNIKALPHHHKNTTTKTPPNHTTTKTSPHKHHHKNTTTKTPPHHHKNTTPRELERKQAQRPQTPPKKNAPQKKKKIPKTSPHPLFHGFMMFHDVSCFFCLCSSCKLQLHATRRSICSWKWFGSQVLSQEGWVAHFKSAHLQSKGWKWWCCLRDGQGHSVGPQESHTWCKMILEWTATAAYCTSCFFNRNNVSVSRFSRKFVSRIFHFREFGEFVFFKFFSNLSLNSQGKGPLPSRRWWVARCMKVLGRL